MTTEAVEVRNLKVRYGRRAVLDGVSLGVPEGAVCALLGRNGAGKTTLLRCLLGQLRPGAGEARLLGLDAWRERSRLMARVGVVPEAPDAPPAMTAEQLGRFSARLYPSWDGSDYERRLRRFGVPRRVGFKSLSRGQKAQVGLALALAPAPRLLVLDEPTLGLDAVARAAFFEELIGELHDRGVTVLLATHDLAGVEGIAERVAILKAGRLVLDEELEVLKARFRRLRLPGERGTEEMAGRLAPLAPLALRSGPWGVEAVVTCGDDLPAAARRGAPLQVAPMSLEEIFIAAAGDPDPKRGGGA